ncbi:MAG: hypothetical protein M5U26_00075 [Planctomycetota bacterium]|nr:hypothetical protein [Planctomycetota bacterium]
MKSIFLTVAISTRSMTSLIPLKKGMGGVMRTLRKNPESVRRRQSSSQIFLVEGSPDAGADQAQDGALVDAHGAADFDFPDDRRGALLAGTRRGGGIRRGFGFFAGMRGGREGGHDEESRTKP